MGLGENSLTNSLPRLGFNPSSVLALPELNSTSVSDPAALLKDLNVDYEELLKLEKEGRIKLTDKQKDGLAEISERINAYNSAADLSSLSDLIQADQAFTKGLVQHFQKEITEQKDIFQAATGLHEPEVVSALKEWRDGGASLENIQETIELEQQKTLTLAETNPDLAIERTRIMKSNLKDLDTVLSDIKPEIIAESSNSTEKKLQNILEKTLTEHRAELKELNQISESELSPEQREKYRERKRDLEAAIQRYEEIMKEEGWEKRVYDSLTEEEKKKLEANPDSDEAAQIVNRAVTDYDETGKIMRGFYALSDDRFTKLLGSNKQEFYNQYQSKYSLDSVLRKDMLRDLRAGTYSDASYYYAERVSDAENPNEANALSGENLQTRLSNLIADLESHGEIRSAEQNQASREIAAKLGLEEDHPIVQALINGDYVRAQELADGTSIAASISNEDDNLLAWTETLSSFELKDHRSFNDFLVLSFA